MRAGLGHPSGGGDESVPAGVDEVARRMMALAVSMVGRAGENAAVYTVHAGRKTVTPSDVNRALQYQAKTFLATVTDAEVEEAAGDVARACEEASSSSEDDDESMISEDSDDDEEEDDDDAGPWTASACACDICAGMNEAHDTWGSYAPEDEALAYLKNLTDKFLEKQEQL